MTGQSVLCEGPQLSAHLDYVSQATFRVRRPARVRVALVGADGWTPIVTSRVLVLSRARRSSRASHAHDRL